MAIQTKIAHLTSVHPRSDIRIFYKQCRSLAASGYDVALLVADGKGNDRRDNVTIIDVGIPKSRLERATLTTRRILRQAVELDASIYHLHDPELLPVGLALKRKGKHVVYDSHEDVPKDILTKPYLPNFARPLVAYGVAKIESSICRRLDGVIAATSSICERFQDMGIPCLTINNFPILNELEPTESVRRGTDVSYVGAMAINRGVLEIIRAMTWVNSGVRLNLAGNLAGKLAALAKQEAGWERVNDLGFLDREGVRDVLAQSAAGLVVLHPTAAFLESLPIKMFEYMSAGVPVIGSNFPLWREVIEKNKCGLLVDPLNPSGIASAINQIVSNPSWACQMGENGRKAVLEKYNWKNEEAKLLNFYHSILSRP